jgi:diaminopimelate decarboxylase
MYVTDLLAEHGSPLWMVDLDAVRGRFSAFAAAWEGEWPDVAIAYSYKANRVPALLRELSGRGAGAAVGSEAEYALARSLAQVDGESIVVQGPAKSRALLERAATDRALVIADSVAELRRAHEAGVRRLGLRVSLPGVGHGPSHFGVPVGEIPSVPRRAAALGVRLEALAVHLVSAGFDKPLAETPRLASDLVVRWPQAPERFGAAARMLAALAVRHGVPVVDMGGGFAADPSDLAYARAVTGALGVAGFEGRLVLEPGRTIVSDAVDLACTVIAVKRLADGSRCVIVDAGTNLVPGTLWRWPTVAATDTTGPPHRGRTMVTGPLCTNVDVLHPAAQLPELAEGDALLIRGVGAYQQTHSTQFGDLRPAIVARDEGEWHLSCRRETVEDLVASDVHAAARGVG